MTDQADGTGRTLSLGGGGAIGMYTLGVLREVEEVRPQSMPDTFDLIVVTSPGSIIATLPAIGKSAEETHHICYAHVPTIMPGGTRPPRQHVFG